MNRRKATLGAAAVGVVAGAVGLGMLAAPAGAGQAPSLPAISPQALVQSVLTAKPTAMGGTVEVDNNLGLPAIPGLPSQLGNGTSQVRVWSDGAGHSRISLPNNASEQTYVDDGTTLYEWNSATKTVNEYPVGQHQHQLSPTDSGRVFDPATVAQKLVSTMQTTSTVEVGGTDTVADRPAYDLVLTPKPQEKTLLRQVQIAIDAQTRLPLRVSVLANGSSTPAIQVGFSSIDVGAQDPSLFHFTPPAGSTVTHGDSTGKQMDTATNRTSPTVVGSGWDTVLVAKLPAGMSSSIGSSSGTGSSGTGIVGSGSRSSDPMSLVTQFGTPVSGAWGHGWVISTNIANALITSDGRVAVGFVPQQVLIQALGSAK
jgi:outer membrane lipoprotein-sorting protein